ncbi:MAG: FKBP-type peptidyl-prolyl cis-trans isomerase [Clostridia bacterium]|nr:FKBP-type peptidyl-prolyl cis-trans isomerase [Clostridia bacterium]
MKKRIICLLLAICTVFIICSCSCVRGDDKYDYDMTEYIKLPNYKTRLFEVEEDAIKQAIGTYLVQFSSEYKVKRGDKINVDVKYFLPNPDIDKKGDELTDLFIDDVWLENVATPNSDNNYQISYQIENIMIGRKLKETVTNKLTMADDFYVEEYRGQSLYVEMTINNKELEMGDVLMASYTGYYVDENNNIIKENDKDKTFDTSDNSAFYIGSHLAIDGFENGLIGMQLDKEKDIYTEFPSTYKPDPTMAGKKVMFRVKVKSLYTAPTYDDAFVTTYFTKFKNTTEFEAALRKEYILSLVLDYISNNVQILEYPQAEYKAAQLQLEEIEGPFAQSKGITLDAYIQSEYGMTRDAYIKSNMKTEMIYYALRNLIGDSVVPTEAELTAERNAQIASYKSYYIQEGMSESNAIEQANSFVDKLGEAFIYEQVLYDKIDNVLPSQVKTKTIPSTYDSYIFDAQVK